MYFEKNSMISGFLKPILPNSEMSIFEGENGIFTSKKTFKIIRKEPQRRLNFLFLI
jgi:hypothetical protein